MISFKVNDECYTVQFFDPGSTLLSYLRENGVKDLKQMCEEGGCGICTLMEVTNSNNQPEARPVSACLVPLAQANNRTFVTSSKLAKTKTGKEICETFAKNFASQCGYCTPGIVVDIASCKNSDQRKRALDGHICRCTGYRPIKQAIEQSTFIDVEDLAELCSSCPKKSQNCQHSCAKIPLSNGHFWHQPNTLADVLDLLKLPDTRVVSGDTSRHCEKYYRNLRDSFENTIDVSNVTELKTIKSVGTEIEIGSSVTIQEFLDLVKDKSGINSDRIVEALQSVGSKQLIGQASMGGSLYLQRRNPSFTSDITVLLGSLDVQLTVHHQNKLKTICLDEFMNFNDDFLVKIKVNIPDAGLITIGKIATRKTMSAGYLTYAFYSGVTRCCVTRSPIGRYYYNNGDGIKTLAPPTKLEKGSVNKCLARIENVRVRSQLLKHFMEVLGSPDDQLDRDHVEFFVDDSTQPDRAKDVPQIHSFQLAAGTATFESDFTDAKGDLHIAFVKAGQVGNIEHIDFEACSADKDFVRGITAVDLKAHGYINCFHQGGRGSIEELSPEEILCSKSVLFINQPIAILVARTRSAAYRLRNCVQVTYSEWSDGVNMKPNALLSDAVKKGDFFTNPFLSAFDSKEKGDVNMAFDDKNLFIVEGEFEQPGQYHNYMETQFARVQLNDNNINIFMGTQALDKVQRSVAHILVVPHASVSVTCRRIGSSFGGKITRSPLIAGSCAIAAKLTNHNCSMHMSVEDCLHIVGGRSIYLTHYKAAFEKSGKCVAIDMNVWSDTGANYNDNIMASMFFASHVENSYHIENFRYSLKMVRTARPAVTWTRAPGETQAILCIERVIDHGCRKYHFDHAKSRELILSQIGDINLIGRSQSSNRGVETFKLLKQKSKYDELSHEVKIFNETNKWKKRGISIQSLEYPHTVSFHTSSVMISVLRQDGSVHATVGGIDMGQGQHTRCAQVVAINLGCDLSRVFVRPSSTDVNSNTSPTGGAISSHTMMLLLNDASDNLKKRMTAEAERQEKTFQNWDDLVVLCDNIDLQERKQGNYSGPGSGYAISAASVAVVELNCLTGEHLIERIEVVFDAGQMINVGTELGQLEGGLMMGISWLKSENLTWNDLCGAEQHGTWDYKVGMHKDLPKVLKFHLTDAAPEFEKGELTNKPRNFPMSAKNAGEAAMSLSFSTTAALQSAVDAFNPEAKYFKLPASPVNVSNALQVSLDSLIIESIPIRTEF